MFTDLKVHQDIRVRSGGNLAIAFRKENPKLRQVVNTWLGKRVGYESHSDGDLLHITGTCGLAAESIDSRSSRGGSCSLPHGKVEYFM